MINTAFISIGANLKFNHKISLRNNLEKVINLFPNYNISVNKISNWYESEPVPISDQPWFVNALVKIQTKNSPKKPEVPGSPNPAKAKTINKKEYFGK